MSFDPTQHLGETVTLRGTAETARAGAVLALPDGTAIYVSGLAEWADDVANRQVEVTGTLIRRPSRLPPAGGDVRYHGLGESIALDAASWQVVA